MKYFILFFLLGQLLILSAQNVEIQGDLKLINGSQGEGKVLVSDEDGVASWETKTDLLIELHKDLPGGLKRLIQWGISPIELWNFGVPSDLLIGINISDGLNGEVRFIFYLDTLDIHPFSYLITGGENFTGNNWACPGVAIPGADSSLFGEGAQNTLDVNTACPPLTNNSVFKQVPNLGPEWHIASVEEGQLIYDELIATGIYDPPAVEFWTSTEAPSPNEATHAFIFNKLSGLITEELKTNWARALTVKVIPD